MARDFYRTTERQRTSAQLTRKRRVAVGKPQPAIVDEALSAAVRSALKTLKRAGDRSTRTSEVTNDIFDHALEHLVEVRGLDRKESWTALTARLVKRRRYTAATARKV